MHRHVWIDERLADVPLFAGLSKKQLELVSSLADTVGRTRRHRADAGGRPRLRVHHRARG